jgi:hypothetical protein
LLALTSKCIVRCCSCSRPNHCGQVSATQHWIFGTTNTRQIYASFFILDYFDSFWLSEILRLIIFYYYLFVWGLRFYSLLKYFNMRLYLDDKLWISLYYVWYNKYLKLLCFNLTKHSHDFHLAKILNDTMATSVTQIYHYGFLNCICT